MKAVSIQPITKILIGLVALTLMIAGVAFATLSAPSAHAAQHVLAQGAISPADTIYGCPSGDACIYPQDAGWNGGQPSAMYYKYGTYKLHNQFGYHYLFNNQTGGAHFLYCYNSDGTNCEGDVPAGYVANVDLTPINSVVLTP